MDEKQILEEFKKYGIEKKDTDGRLDWWLYKDGDTKKAMSIFPYIFFPTRIGTGKFKNVSKFCCECGQPDGVEIIEITREATPKEIQKMQKNVIKFVIGEFKDK